MFKMIPTEVGDSLTPSGRKLTKLQEQVVDALTVTKMSEPSAIAEHVECSPKEVYRILGLQHVKEAIIKRVNGLLLSTAVPAMVTQSSLLTSKSDYVKHQAASDLLNRNDIGVSTTVNTQAVQVKIDLS